MKLKTICQISMMSVSKALRILIFKYTTILNFWIQIRVQSPFPIWIDNPYICTNLHNSIGPVLVRSGRTRPANLGVRSCPGWTPICPVRLSPGKKGNILYSLLMQWNIAKESHKSAGNLFSLKKALKEDITENIVNCNTRNCEICKKDASKNYLGYQVNW